MFEAEQQALEEIKEKIISLKKEVGAPVTYDEYNELYLELLNLIERYDGSLVQIKETTDMVELAITDLLENSFDLKDKVHFDPLTGIYNRRYLDEALIHNIKTMPRYGGILTILIIDIDYFKKYNDFYGHARGDVCLRKVARVISDNLTREGDFVARYGGEEFVVVLPHVDRAGADYLANKLLEAVRESNIEHKNSDIAEYVTFSVGATTIRVHYNHDPKDYISHADAGLYEAKNNGRNRYVFTEFDHSLTEM